MAKKNWSVVGVVLLVALMIFVIVFANKGNISTGWIGKETEQAAESVSVVSTEETISNQGEYPGDFELTEIYNNRGSFSAEANGVRIEVGDKSSEIDGLSITPRQIDSEEKKAFVFYGSSGKILNSGVELKFGEPVPDGDIIWKADSLHDGKINIYLHVIDPKTEKILGMFCLGIQKNKNEQYELVEIYNNEADEDIYNKINSLISTDIKTYCIDYNVSNIVINEIRVEPLADTLYTQTCHGILGGTTLYANNIKSYPIYAVTATSDNTDVRTVVFYYSEIEAPEGELSFLPVGFQITEIS